MSRRKSDPIVEQEVTTEEDLQDKWSGHPSPLVDSVLSARRERERKRQPFLSIDEVNKLLGRDDGDED